MAPKSHITDMKKPVRPIRGQVMLSHEEKRAYYDLAIKQGIDFSELVRRLLREELNRLKKEEAA